MKSTPLLGEDDDAFFVYIKGTTTGADAKSFNLTLIVRTNEEDEIWVIQEGDTTPSQSFKLANYNDSFITQTHALKGFHANLFTIDASTGVITAKTGTALDAASLATYDLFIETTISPKQNLTGFEPVSLERDISFVYEESDKPYFVDGDNVLSASLVENADYTDAANLKLIQDADFIEVYVGQGATVSVSGGAAIVTASGLTTSNVGLSVSDVDDSGFVKIRFDSIGVSVDAEALNTITAAEIETDKYGNYLHPITGEIWYPAGTRFENQPALLKYTLDVDGEEFDIIAQISVTDVKESDGLGFVSSAEGTTVSKKDDFSWDFEAKIADSDLPINYFLAGTDASLFTIDQITGVVTFADPDADTSRTHSDGVFKFTVYAVHDTTNFVTKDFTLTVANQQLTVPYGGTFADAEWIYQPNNSDDVTFSLSGDHANLFALSAVKNADGNYVLTVSAAENSLFDIAVGATVLDVDILAKSGEDETLIDVDVAIEYDASGLRLGNDLNPSQDPDADITISVPQHDFTPRKVLIKYYDPDNSDALVGVVPVDIRLTGEDAQYFEIDSTTNPGTDWLRFKDSVSMDKDSYVVTFEADVGNDTFSRTVTFDVNKAPTTDDVSVNFTRGSNSLALTSSMFTDAYNDEDNDALAGIYITRTPQNDYGALYLSNEKISAGDRLEASDLENLVFRPSANNPLHSHTISVGFKVFNEIAGQNPGQTYEHISADEAFIIVRVPILSDSSNVLRLLDDTLEVPSKLVVPSNDGGVDTMVLTKFISKPDDFVYTLSDDRFEIVGDEIHVKEDASFDVEPGTEITVKITATKTETIDNGSTTSTTSTTILDLDFIVTILAPEYEFAALPSDIVSHEILANPLDRTTQPSDRLKHTDENDTITGTTASEIIQGGDGDDTLISGGGRDVIIGGKGDDTITLGDGAQSVVYRFTSGSDALSWSFADGADTVNNFKIGEDSLVLVEQNDSSVNSLSALLTAISDTLPENTVQLVFTKDGNTYTALEIKVAGTGDGVTFVFDEAIDGTLATTISAAAGTNGTLDVTSTSAQSIIAQLFTATGSDDAGGLLDVTNDSTPSGIDII